MSLVPLRVVFVLIFLQAISFAQTTIRRQPFVNFFDCLRVKGTPPPDIDVFTRVSGSQKEWKYNGEVTRKGINIDLVLSQDGQINGIVMDPINVNLSLDDLKAGVQFGALKKTMQTMQVNPDFDPNKGGKLTLGILSRISIPAIARDHVVALFNPTQLEQDLSLLKAKRDYSQFGLSGSLARYYNSLLYPDLWKEETFDIVKRGDNWTILNSKGQEIDTIFAEVKILDQYSQIFLGLDQISSEMSKRGCPSSGADPKLNWDAIDRKLNSAKKTDIIECNRQ